ncbi:MAG: glycoside hydrolase family 9 protein [Christensenellales bacterium]
MKKQTIRVNIVYLFIAMLMILVACEGEAKPPEETTQPDDGQFPNMVVNGDFSNGTENWMLFLDKGGAADFKVIDEQAVIDIKTVGYEDYGVQLYYDGFKLETGGVYRFAFDASSNIERTIGARLQLNGGDYFGYADDIFYLTNKMERFYIEFVMEAGTDPAPRLCFNIGAPKDGTAVPSNMVFIDNVEVSLIDGRNVLMPEPEPERPQININQLGYKADAVKIAVFRGDRLGSGFEIVDQNGATVFEGELKGPIESTASDEINYLGDFSSFKTLGTYYIKSGAAVESYPFEISDSVYDDAFASVFKMLYLQRCGCALDESIAGKFTHEACHMQYAVIYGTDITKEVTGGWHDAGDYGRYVVPGAKAAADLLFTFEDFKELLSGQYGDSFGIPESGNGIPDILDEARYELEWMHKMQDDVSGGVYHKVTGLSFPGEVTPTEETEQMYIAPISTPATGSFAAVMAMSYLTYKPYDAEFAEKCLEAAKKAWTYLQNNLDSGFKNPDDILTGEYPDKLDKDERYWAAAALFKATGERHYIEEFERILDLYVYVLDGYGWDNVGGYGNKIYLSLDEGSAKTESVQKIKDAIERKAEGYLKLSKEDGYGSSLGMTYPWGSNMTVCDNARYLLFAGELLGREDFKQAAERHFHYVFGVNPMSLCYVTGLGASSPKNTHHRPSMVAQESMPGMLAGGPNSRLEDPFAKAVLIDMPPAKCYADNSQSYSCNEVTVYWNSPLIYLMASVLNGQ